MLHRRTRHVTVLTAAGLAALAVAVPAGQSQDVAFCKNATVVNAMTKLGPVTPLKTFNVQGGVWCQYGGTHGQYVEEIPHYTQAKFAADQTSRRGKAFTGLGVPAFSTSGPGTYAAVFALKGSTEVAVGASSTLPKISAAVKAILPVIH